MLELRDIYKDYPSGDDIVRALKGVSIKFRDSEFVSILGQSGCGKTTLLNIIGGLDHYTTGDLVINGRSTKGYNDKDWDTYRNHSIGFVFQSYNLIPHQTVLRNVELALTISGVGRRERTERAEEALIAVGLGDQMHKKPNQLSGGQMQRVAIARALVNNPDIVLADEPTGALDSETSVQVMEILKQVSQTRLVIMVTHNPELAMQYSTRVVRLLDGRITEDSDPFEPAPQLGGDWSRRPQSKRERRRAIKEARKASGKGKRRMSFLTALNLSMRNLLTKKGRTVLTAFAGSIGIIGIALILSLSNGAQGYINSVEQDTLSSYPVQLQSENVDMSAMLAAMGAMTGSGGDEVEGTPTEITTDNVMTSIIERLGSGSTHNDLGAFRDYIENGDGHVIYDYANDVRYGYDVILNVYSSDTSDGVVQVNPSTLMSTIGLSSMSTTALAENDSAAGSLVSSMSSMSPMMSEVDAWDQLLNNQEVLDSQYDVLAGRMPQSYDEVVLITDKDGHISDYLLYTLGLKDQQEVADMLQDVVDGEDLSVPNPETYAFDDFLGMTFKLVPASSRYQQNADGTWTDMSEDEAFMTSAISAAEDLTVVGVICPNENASIEETNGAIGYRADLTEHLIELNNSSAIAQAQQADPTVDVFTGLPFATGEETAAPTYTMDDVYAYMATLDAEMQAAMQAQIDQAYAAGMTDDQIVEQFAAMLPVPQESDATYEGNLEKMGVADVSEPTSIEIYAKDFESKELITNLIEDYNAQMEEDGEESKVLQYTDYVGLMMSSVRTVIDAISYILIAFVAISLVVSSIMIGIITYISVLERTKEIGILRAIGASKRDVSRVFNAETFVIGLLSGVLGIAVTLLLLIPANLIIHNLTGIANMAQLPWIGAGILIVISVLLTLIGGIIPSRMAAKRDPVTALRTE